MKFEFLPNEIILNLFEYIPTYDLIHGFYNLNSRFHKLLRDQFKIFHLNLELLSKTKCTDICQNIVPLIIDQIIFLRLSNDDNTSYAIELFLSQNYQLRQLTHLKSISLNKINSIDVLNQLMIECIYLPHLTYLLINIDSREYNQSDADHLYNQIWSLKNLTHCSIDIGSHYQINFPKLTFISTSMKNFTSHQCSLSFSTLNYLFENTPNLEYLSIKFEDTSDQLGTIIPMLSLTQAKVNFQYGSIDTLEHFLQYMPNLSRLTLSFFQLYVDGHEWEDIIRKYLLKLKVLHFQTSFTMWDGEKFTLQIDEIIDTFRTRFWIEERQWFVRCDFNFSDNIQIACYDLFTLPYNFNRFFHRHRHISSASTYPSNENYFMYERVSTLSYEWEFPPDDIRFPNIECLSLSFPFGGKLFTIISKFDRLKSLYFCVNKFYDDINSDLQLVINQAPHLRLLHIINYVRESDDRMLVKEINSNSIRELSLRDVRMHFSYNDEKCIELSHTSLGRQCETLSIKVKNRKNVLDLINMMPKLQALNVQCDDDAWKNLNDKTLLHNKNDELVKWLENQLPSTFIIRRHTFRSGIIQIWIR